MKKLLLMTITLLSSASLLKADTELITVAESDFQWTGVTVSKDKRIFVNYPTWKVPSPFKVAELVDGKEVAYPSEEDQEMFVCVQSVVVDELDRLWILDPASPNFKGVVSEGPYLYQVDLAKNEIVRTYKFSERAYSKKSYLNDVRIDTQENTAYVTDSGEGGIVLLDLGTGESWRALDKSCNAVLANLDGINFKSTGSYKNITNSDGLELSDDKLTLYFSALTGDILYEIPTAVLRDRSMSPEERCGHIKITNKTNVPADGFILHNDKLYMANLPEEGVWEYDLVNGKGRTLDFGTTIRWADSFAKDSEGYVYFTTSQINYPENQRIKYGLFKFRPE
ncbi:MAG: major royal jelly family protein [Rikenellaceae bacterium]|nr:major royal jelly family protein [Rikenellaceae bacterium]